jgi:hypothetical protein
LLRARNYAKPRPRGRRFGNDYAEHEQMYRSFVALVKWSIGVIVVILILMAFFLV